MSADRVLHRVWLSRSQSRAWSIDNPVGDPFGGPAYGQKTDLGSVLTIGANLIGGFMSSDAQSSAANTAAGAQIQAAQLQTQEAKRQFDQVQNLLAPYVTAGSGSFNANSYLAANPDVARDPYWSQHPYEHWVQYGKNEGRQGAGFTGGALSAQQDLLGLNGTQAQQKAIAALSSSPEFTGLVKQGEDAMLANASATGGLRGGNLQAALAQFRPNMLNQLIQQRFQNLGGLTALGQNAAAGVGNAGQNASSAIINALGQQGAAQAGAALASGKADASLWSGLAGTIGQLNGQGAFNNLFNGSSTGAGYFGGLKF